MSDPLEALAAMARQEAEAHTATRRWREQRRAAAEQAEKGVVPGHRPGDLLTEAAYHAVREAQLLRDADEFAQASRRKR